MLKYSFFAEHLHATGSVRLVLQKSRVKKFYTGSGESAFSTHNLSKRYVFLSIDGKLMKTFESC